MPDELILAIVYYMQDNAHWYTGIANGVVDTRLLARDAREHFDSRYPTETYVRIAEEVANGEW